MDYSFTGWKIYNIEQRWDFCFDFSVSQKPSSLEFCAFPNLAFVCDSKRPFLQWTGDWRVECHQQHHPLLYMYSSGLEKARLEVSASTSIPQRQLFLLDGVPRGSALLTCLHVEGTFQF